MRNSFRFVAALLGSLTFAVFTSSAQLFSPLHTFTTANGIAAPLVFAQDGFLYGTSSLGGLTNAGSIFKVAPDGSSFTVLYSFTNGMDGSGPVAGLVISGNTLYGTARNAGSGGHGTVFKINTDGSGFTPIYSFTTNNAFGTNSDGAFPQSKLALTNGVLYGTTSSGGGHNNAGTLFKLNTDGTGFAVLYTFNGPLGGSGAYPLGGLTISGDMLYGTAEEGGSNFNGIVFGININGGGYTNLHHFAASLTGTNADGYYPVADLLISGNMLYGTAMNGTPSRYGTIFRMNTDGTGFTNLYNFTNGVDGASPQSALALSGSTLYGTTKSGGISPGYGTLFKIDTDGTGFGVVYTFDGRSGGPGQPVTGVVISGGTLFGTTTAAIYGFNTNGTNLSVLSTGNEGSKPLGGLVLSGNTFYGTTSAGGGKNSGTIFQVNAGQSGFNTLYTFSAAPSDLLGHFTNSDGSSPRGSLLLAGGKLYGIANAGGSNGAGTIFSINTNGTGFTNLHTFGNGTDGKSPAGGLVLGGNTLYGAASFGGTNGVGSIFKINADGSGYSALYDFSPAGVSNTDGYYPNAPLVLLGDSLYGTALGGGTNGSGTLFRIGTNGEGFTVLFMFATPTGGTDTTNVNGASPSAGLTASGNTLFGTAASGGFFDNKGGEAGTIYKINADGTEFTLLHKFAGIFEGSSPAAALAVSGNTLYGTTSSGGQGSAGTVFQMDTNGNNFTTIHTFLFQGGTPLGDLLVANGKIFGTSEFSEKGSGYVFSITPTGVPTIHFTATPTTGIPPQAVQFTAPGIDDNGSAILGWYWNFDDGTPTYTITYNTNREGMIATNYNYINTQNPLHTYTNSATFHPSLVATNNNGTMVLGIGPAIAIAYPASILNGGFETGTFTNWTRTGIGGSGISTASQYKHSGTYGAQLLASGGLGFLSQTITTTPGSSYLVTFWLDVPFNFTPNEFLVNWGGTALMDQTNIPNIGWTNVQFLVTATSATTTLQFGYRDSYFGLDDVSVVPAQPVIAKLTLSGTNLVLNNSGGISNRSYILFSSTNAALPINQWIPVTTNLLGSNGVFSLTGTNVISPNTPRQYFILQMR